MIKHGCLFNTKRLLTCLQVIFLFINNGFAQNIYKYNTYSSECYTEYSFIKSKSYKINGVITICLETDSLSNKIKESVFYTSLLFKDFDLLFINVINPANDLTSICEEKIIQVISKTEMINTNSFVFILSGSQNLIIKSKYSFVNYNPSADNEASLYTKIIEQLKNVQYEIPLEQDPDLLRDLRLKNYKNNFKLGLAIAPTFLYNERVTNGNYLTSYDIYLEKNINNNWSLGTNFNFSYSMPNQNEIQSSMQSKVMEAVQNGDKEMYVDLEIKSFFQFQTGAFIKYSFKQIDKLRPYLKFGLTNAAVTTIKGRIKDTIDISSFSQGSGSSTSGMPSFGSPDDNKNMETNNKVYLNLLSEIGFSYRFSPVMSLNMAIPNLVYFNNANYKNMSTGLSFGLSFTFNSRRLKKKY